MRPDILAKPFPKLRNHRHRSRSLDTVLGTATKLFCNLYRKRVQPTYIIADAMSHGVFSNIRSAPTPLSRSSQSLLSRCRHWLRHYIHVDFFAPFPDDQKEESIRISPSLLLVFLPTDLVWSRIFSKSVVEGSAGRVRASGSGVIESKGGVGLRDRSSRPHCSPRSLSEEKLLEIEQLRRHVGPNF